MSWSIALVLVAVLALGAWAVHEALALIPRVAKGHPHVALIALLAILLVLLLHERTFGGVIELILRMQR
jgi:hypothetical protein